MPQRGGFDECGHLVMDGMPRFVLGVYDSGGGYSTSHEFWEQQIFVDRNLSDIPINVYLNYFLGAMPIHATVPMLDVLDAHAVMYLQTGNCFEDGSWTRMFFSISEQPYVETYAQHPAALGYYIMDECFEELIPETEAHHQCLKAWDAEGVTFACNYAAGYRDPAKWTTACDVLGTDPYPLYGVESGHGYTHFIVGDYVSKLRAAHRADRPVWAVLQFFRASSDARLPTFAELRAHAIMAIVEGAQGIMWWDVGVNGIRQHDTNTVAEYMGYLRALISELAGLEHVLLADPAPDVLAENSSRYPDAVEGRIAQLDHNISVEWLYSRIEWYQAERAALLAGDTSKSGGMIHDVADVRTLVKVVEGVAYVFAYNYTNHPITVTFSAADPVARVTESSSHAVYDVTDGDSWTDTFTPYEGKIYLVTLGTSPPDPQPEPPATVEFSWPVTYQGQTVTARVKLELPQTAKRPRARSHRGR